MSLIPSILGVAFLVVATRHFWAGLNEDRIPLGSSCFWGWLGKGLVFPALIWGLVNAGFWPGLTSFVPEVALGQAGRGRAWALFMTDSLWLMGTYWAAVSFAWMLGWNLVATAERREAVVLVAVTALLVSPLAVLFVYLGSWSGSGLAMVTLLLPGVHFTTSMVSSVQPAPSYSKAVARLKRGHFAEAEWEVICELEKFEGDFEGWMMLAEMYARQFRDLEAAEQTVVELCEQPGVNVAQRSVALHRLADWHLELAGDPVGARLALEAICAKVPGTHLDRMARQRLEQIPATRQEWEARRERGSLKLPGRERNPGLDEAGMGGTTMDGLSSEEALLREERCLDRLREDSNDRAAREELAQLWAVYRSRPKDAVEQVNLLLDMPDFPEAEKPRILGRLVSWLERGKAEGEMARACRLRLVREFPRSREAFTAQKQLLLNRSGMG